MNVHTNKSPENKNGLADAAAHRLQKNNQPTFQLINNRAEYLTQCKLQEMAYNSPQATHIARLQSIADNYNLREQVPIQKKDNKTGLPDYLKTGIENLSGYSMDDVTVHRNSSKPAQLQAHAYAQGTDIHLAPGQEKHLPHEAWHVVQQKQGRVQPTLQLNGKVNINDDVALEKEADVMGKEAMQNNHVAINQANHTPEHEVFQKVEKVIQAKMYDSINKDIPDEELGNYEWKQHSTAELRGVLEKMEDQATKEKIEGIISARNQKEQTNKNLLSENNKDLEQALKDRAKYSEDRSKWQSEIDREIDLIYNQNDLKDVPGMSGLVAQIKKGNDSWKNEAAPYLRELFLGISEKNQGGVQMGAIGGKGGDVVYGGGTERHTTLQSKYFTTSSLDATVNDLAKGINQLSGEGGEMPIVGSKREVDVVIDNVELEKSINMSKIREVLIDAVEKTATNPMSVDKILITLPNTKQQYRATIVEGKLQGIVMILINPKRFDLPEIHQTSSGESIKKLFEERDKILVSLRGLEDKIQKLEQSVKALTSIVENVHNGEEVESSEEGFGIEF